MGTKLYIGNLNYRTTDVSLAAAFTAAGFTVASAKVIIDRETGQSRGFAFVEMASDDDAKRALEAMQGRDVEGRNLNVTEARERGPASAGPRVGPPRIGPPVNRTGPTIGPRVTQGGGDMPHRPARPSNDFSRPAFGGNPMMGGQPPHPDLIDPNAASEGRNKDSRRERREYKGSRQHERDDDDDDY